MKFLRLLLLATAAVLVAAGLVLAVALDSRVQTWAAHRALGDHGSARVRTVDAGFTVTTLTGVHVARAGAVLDLPQVELEFPPLAAYFDHRLLIRNVVARGWTLDLRNARGGVFSRATPALRLASRKGSSFSLLSTAHAEQPVPIAVSSSGHAEPMTQMAEPFRGIFADLGLPFDLALQHADLEGDVLVPAGPGVPPVMIHVSLSGGGLAAGEEGRFVLRATATPTAPGPVDKVMAEGVLSGTMDTPHSFTRLALRLNAAAFGAQLGSGVRLVADAAASRGPNGENYSVVLSSETKPLIAVLAQVPMTGERPSGTWRLDVADEDVSPFLLGRELPRFDLAGQGQADADPRGQDVHVSGGLRASLDRLSALRPELAPIGAVDASADFDLTRRGSLWRVDWLTASVQGGQPILTARSLQPFAVNPDDGELQVANAGADLFAVELRDLPVAWLQIADPALVFNGQSVRGVIVGSAREGGLHLRTNGPLTAAGLTAGPPGRTWVENGDAQLGVQADFSPAGWQVGIDGASLRQGPALIFEGQAKLGRRMPSAGQPLKVEGGVHALLPALLALPAFRAGALTGGEASVQFSATIAASDSVQAAVKLTHLAADPQVFAGALPDVTADLRLDVAADGKISLRAPLTLATANRQSAVTFEGGIGLGFTGPRFEGTLSGAHLALEDVPTLVPLFAVAKGGGALGLALDRVDFGRFAATSVRGTLRYAGEGAALEVSSSRLVGGGPLTLTAELLHGSTSDGAHYTLSGTLKAAGVDAATLLGRPDPSRPAPIEGKFDLDGSWSGVGSTPTDAVANSQAAAGFTSKGGTFRMLAAELTPKAVSSNIAVTALRSAAGAVGSLVKRLHTDAFPTPEDALAQAAKAIGEIPYDQVTFKIVRDAGHDVICQDFALIAPEIRLEGGGHLDYQAGTDLEDWPLSVRLTLLARGRVADALKYLALLDPKPDHLGYRPCTLPVTIGGTYGRPDATETQAALLKAVADRSGDILDKLLGK